MATPNAVSQSTRTRFATKGKCGTACASLKLSKREKSEMPRPKTVVRRSKGFTQTEIHFEKEDVLILGEYGKGYGKARWSVMGPKAGQIADFRTRKEAMGFAKSVVKLGWATAFEKKFGVRLSGA